jgi:hypothetical protein
MLESDLPPDDNTVHALVLLGKQGKDTDTHSEYIILIAFPQQQWLRERAPVLLLLLVIRARSEDSGCTAVIRLILHPVFF